MAPKSSGDFTIGNDGQHYPSVNGSAGIIADMANPLTGTLKGTIETDIVETTTTNISLNLNYNELIFDSSIPHEGDPTKGHLISINHSGFFIQYNAYSGGPAESGTLIIRNLHIKRTGLTGSRVLLLSGNVTTARRVYNNLIDGNAKSGSIGIQYAVPAYIWNNVVWDHPSIGIQNNGSDDPNGCVTNNTIYDCGTGFDGRNLINNVNNNMLWGNTNNCVDIGGSDGANNISDDATNDNVNWSTGSGNLTSKTILDNVQSISDTNSAFMDIVANSDADGGGITNVIISRYNDIRGRVVPGPNGTSMGATELQGTFVNHGDYSLGASGQAFPGLSGAAGLAANIAPPLTGNLSGTYETAVTESVSVTLSADLGTYTFLLDSDTPHNGNPNAGHLITSSAIFLQDNTSNGTSEVRNLNIIKTGGSVCFYSQAGDSSRKYHDNLINGNSACTRGFYWQQTAATPLFNVYNNIFWDFNTVGIYIQYDNAGVSYYFENNVCYDCTTGYLFGASGTNIHSNNNMGWANGSGNFSISGNTGKNNISDDNSNDDTNWGIGSGNLINKAILDNVKSTDHSNKNFMNIVFGSDSDGTGITNLILARLAGIRGNVVPGLNGTSRGAAEVGAGGWFKLQGRNELYNSMNNNLR